MAARNGKNANVTIYDIASELGVGKTTVSLALSGRGNISAATRAAVLEKARLMGFAPNQHAQRLSNGRCDKSIFLFIESLFPGTGTQRADLIQGGLRKYGFDVPVYTYGGVWPPGDAEQLMTSLCRQRPRAIVYHGQYSPGVVDALTHYCEGGGIAVCYSDTAMPPFDTVGFDYAGSAYAAVRYLHESGHRDIGFYCPQPDDRFMAGIERALTEVSLSLRPEWNFTGPAQEEGGLALAEQFLSLGGRPTALCVVNDAGASVFINQILRAGLRVPRDVSICGFDDTIHARTCIVPLTTMRQPVEEIASEITEMVVSRVEGRYHGPPRHTMVRSELIVRASASPLVSTSRPVRVRDKVVNRFIP